RESAGGRRGEEEKADALPVGLVNQGNTCYLNSLLQTMFHVPELRKVVLEAAVAGEGMGGGGTTVPALGLVFSQLSKGGRAGSTWSLTRAMGIDPQIQQDAQEFGRFLFMNMEEEAVEAAECGDKTGGAVGDTIRKLFSGRLLNYIECVDVDFSKEGEEAFYDLPLDIKGCQGLEESLHRFTEPELLTGDNRWRAGEHGLQDARKGVRFLEFPPVLQFHLKRFQYDPYVDSLTKVNDRFEFPTTLNTSPWLEGRGGDTSGSSSLSARWVHWYSLRAVVIHEGWAGAGHYYAYVRPSAGGGGRAEEGQGGAGPTGGWVKLDDERVIAVSEGEVMEDAFGGGGGGYR
ncbi:unnamed protein product, partial [Discosporangium mesarthrocarpum]